MVCVRAVANARVALVSRIPVVLLLPRYLLIGANCVRDYIVEMCMRICARTHTLIYIVIESTLIQFVCRPAAQPSAAVIYVFSLSLSRLELR